MGKTYSGVNDISRQVRRIYVGVNGVAHTVSHAYIGDGNGVARIVFSNPVLPAAYQQVAYIEGTGTQYINTGVYLSVNTLAMQADIRLTSNAYANSGALIFGGINSSISRFYAMIISENDSASKQKRADMGLGNGWWTDSAAADTTNRHVYKVDMNSLKVYKDGVSKGKTSSAAFSKKTDSALWLGLFAGLNSSGNLTPNKIKGCLYSAKIWQANTLIHDYYPCYRKSDNKPGLYDIIANTFLTNAGTGDFNVGPNYEGKL